MTVNHNRYLLILSIIFVVWWLYLAITPNDRTTWLLENVLVFAAAVLIAVTYRKIPLSRISYTLIFLFLCLHAVGAHYTYAETPYDYWIKNIFGFSLNEVMGFERNHYDRMLHLFYGLLLAYPIRELFIRIADVKGFWAYFLPFDITVSTSALYELIEWGAASVFGGDAGMAYLGTQGDPWDAQKDMILAATGALIAMSVTALINVNLQRDFAKEWNDSLKIKGKYPLGEDEIIKMWQKRNQ